VPIKKSAAKQLRKSKKRQVRNKAAKSAMRTAIRKVGKCLEAKDAEGAREALKRAISVIGKTAEKGIIHKNKAARHQASLMKKVYQFLSSEK
jgi:small subunit ribosomal protein S20